MTRETTSRNRRRRSVRQHLLISAGVMIAAVLVCLGLLGGGSLLAGDSEPTTRPAGASDKSACCDAPGAKIENAGKETDMSKRVEKSDAEWRAQLSEMQYHVMREKGTERAFAGAYHAHKGDGQYLCAGCGAELFDSETKYDSGSGWPSYWQPVEKEAIAYIQDDTHGMIRTEATCSRCDAHLGHVFEDGPQPTGLRYCINSASLAFTPRDDPEDRSNQEDAE